MTLHNVNFKSETKEESFLNSLNDYLNEMDYSTILNQLLDNASYKISSFNKFLEGMNYVYLIEECKGNNQARPYSATLETRIKNVQTQFSELFGNEYTEVEVFKKLAREGRKFGCFLMLSSQRQSELSSTVLSQCNNYIVHRIKILFLI